MSTRLLVMPSNNTGIRVGHLAGKYPGRIGHLYSPGAQKGPFDFVPYALDNGAFGAFVHRRTFDVTRWYELLGWSKQSAIKPLWVLVPDAVGDRDGTLAMWRKHADTAAGLGAPLAFAAQDGMTFDDVPGDAGVVFLGGSTEWKRQAIRPWCARFPRVHVGRINTYRWLHYCADAGAESCDGTGWTRGDQEQWAGLELFLAEQAGESQRAVQLRLFDEIESTPAPPRVPA